MKPSMTPASARVCAVFLAAVSFSMTSNLLLGRPAQSAARGRGPVQGPPVALTPEQQAEAQLAVENNPKLKEQQEQSRLVQLIRTQAMRLGRNPPSRKFAFASNSAIKKLDISKSQEADVAELDACTRKLLTSLALGDLASVTKPPLERERAFASTQRKKEELLRLSEMILMRTILSPQQAEDVKVLCWIASDYDALFDPELASRLGIVPRQKDELKLRYDRYVAVYNALPREATSADSALAEDAYQKYRDTLDQARGQIWGVLTPRQMQEWKAMVRRVGGQS